MSSTITRAWLTMCRASGASRAARRVSILATSRTASRVRSFPLMCSAFKEAFPASISNLYHSPALSFREDESPRGTCFLPAPANSRFLSGCRPFGMTKHLLLCHCLAKRCQIFLCQCRHFHLRIGDDVSGLAFRQQGPVIRAHQFVVEYH